MNDDLDRALREQARSFSVGDDVTTPDLDAVVRRSAARQRARIAAGSMAVLLVLAIAVVGVAARPDTADLATVPDPVPTTASVGTTDPSVPPESVPSPVTTGTTTVPAPTTATTPAPTSTTSVLSTTTPPPDPTCTVPGVGLVITYPRGWSEAGCSRFDPEPQGEPVGTDSEFVAVWLNELEEDLPTAITLLQTTHVDTFVSGERLRFGAFDAYCYEQDTAGIGLLPEGRRVDGCMVELPTGVVMFSTFHDPQDPASSHRAEMRGMAERARPTG